MSDDPTQLVKERTEQLLDEGDLTDAVAFRGLQYDLGLAWIHFPEGWGGLGLARPTSAPSTPPSATPRPPAPAPSTSSA
nr:hypothetical protein [Iamia sp. SCSIO 61187]